MRRGVSTATPRKERRTSVIRVSMTLTAEEAKKYLASMAQNKEGAEASPLRARDRLCFDAGVAYAAGLAREYAATLEADDLSYGSALLRLFASHLESRSNSKEPTHG